MAVDALARRDGVSAGERESHRVVIKLRVEPVVGGVARFACRRELGLDVVRIHRRLEVRGVTRIALRGETNELATGSAFVAGIAVDSGVGPSQREAVIVLLDVFDSNLPSADGVTGFAIGPELALVNVGVAVLAALSHIGEHHLDVALRAGHGGMHAAQRISRLIVIEFRDGADRLPRSRSVTVLTRNVQTSVRTVRAAGVLCVRADCAHSDHHDRWQKKDLVTSCPSPHGCPLLVLYPPREKAFTGTKQRGAILSPTRVSI